MYVDIVLDSRQELVSKTKKIDDDTLEKFANNMLDVFNSPVISDMFRLKGWAGQESSTSWPSDPEKFGVDISSKGPLSAGQRENYDFWSKIAADGFQVGSGRTATQSM